MPLLNLGVAMVLLTALLHYTAPATTPECIRSIDLPIRYSPMGCSLTDNDQALVIAGKKGELSLIIVDSAKAAGAMTAMSYGRNHDNRISLSNKNELHRWIDYLKRSSPETRILLYADSRLKYPALAALFNAINAGEPTERKLFRRTHIVVNYQPQLSAMQ